MKLKNIDMEYKYFVSFSHGSDWQFGLGFCSIIRDCPIASFSDVESMANALRRKHGKNITIISYKLIKAPNPMLYRMRELWRKTRMLVRNL